MEKQEDAYFLQFTDILSNKDICMVSEMKRRVCRSLVVTDIGKTLKILDNFKIEGLLGEKNSPVQNLSVNLYDIEAAQNSVLAGRVAWIGVWADCGVPLASKPNMINLHSICAAEFWLIVTLCPDLNVDWIMHMGKAAVPERGWTVKQGHFVPLLLGTAVSGLTTPSLAWGQ